MRSGIAVESVDQVAAWMQVVVLKMSNRSTFSATMRPNTPMADRTTSYTTNGQSKSIFQTNGLPALGDVKFATCFLVLGHKSENMRSSAKVASRHLSMATNRPMIRRTSNGPRAT